MKLLFLSVGKPKQPETSALFEDYCDRIRRMGIRLDSRWVRESAGEQAMKKEAAALLAAIPPRFRTIALDRTGELMDSVGLASVIEEWSTPAAAFVIGGPQGLHRSFVEQADRCWALSPLTFPHELARAILSEQVYRAVTIVKRIPYHK